MKKYLTAAGFSKYSLFTLLISLLSHPVFSQQPEPGIKTIPLFEKVSKAIKDFKPDTTTPPEDKLTRMIREMRALRGGFNINEIIEYKIEEDREKKNKPGAELDAIAAFFTKGDGKRWLDNAAIWTYRKYFTYREMKQLVRFYKTGAGQKFAEELPVIIIQTLLAGEMILKTMTEKPKE